MPQGDYRVHSKHHQLDNVVITGLLEPVPGTQTIVDYLNDGAAHSKVYPPNTTLMVGIESGELTCAGELTKVVVSRCRNSRVNIGSATNKSVLSEIVFTDVDQCEITIFNDFD